MPALVLLLFLVSAGAQTSLLVASGRFEHTNEVERALAALLPSVEEAEAAERGYIASGGRRFLDLYLRHREEWRPRLDRATRLAADDAYQTQRLSNLTSFVIEHFVEMDAMIAAYDRGLRGSDLAPAMSGDEDRIDHIRGAVTEMEHEEARLALTQQHKKDLAAYWSLALFGCTGFAFASLVAAIVLQRRSVNREAALSRLEQEANERYRALVAAVGDIVWTNSPEGEARGPQPAWCAYTGQSEEEAQGYGWTKAVHPQDVEPTLEAWKHALATRSTFVVEHRVRRADGVYRWFAVRAVPVLGQDGALREWVGLHRDVEVEKSAAEREHEARVAAEEASRVKDEFLAMLGHELRNPLSPITTAVQLMKLRGVEAHEVSVIERQAGHLTRLVNDLLDVSRITQGKVVLDRQLVEVADVVATAIETASAAIERGKHSLRVEVPSRLVVDADRLRMAQVFSNLLTNAAKYTRPGGCIALKAAREGSSVVVRVEDNGDGITRELLPRIFDMFVQSRQTLARSQGGLGLGLTIVKSLVGLHGGTVSAESEGPGQGSRFTVRLPANEGASTPPQKRTVVAAKEVHANRVLVVDDNTDVARTLAQAVEALGYETAIAHDGLEALKVAVQFGPDVALLDIGLPVMDGYELAGRLREQRGEALKLFAITGYGQASDRRRSREAGFQEHLTKPVDLAQLEALLRDQGIGHGHD